VEKMTVGEKIQKIRKEKGLTQKKLSELSNIHEVQIRQYELGKANPKIETINKIANALNVDICNLIEIPFNNDSAPPHAIKRDVTDILSDTEELLKQEGLTFNGEPISEESINSIISAMKIGMEMAKQNNKKYTPNKYKQKSSHEPAE
jgi:Predicted transcriptional regulator with C-terminal CBS domains